MRRSVTDDELAAILLSIARGEKWAPHAIEAPTLNARLCAAQLALEMKFRLDGHVSEASTEGVSQSKHDSLGEAIAEAFSELEPGDVVTVHELDDAGEACAVDDERGIACTCGRPYKLVVPSPAAA